MRILLIGGSGILGTELRKLNHDIFAPSHEDLDITSNAKMNLDVDVIINAAAIKDNRAIEQDPINAINVNIIGAATLAKLCSQQNIRYVYISTDYIYKGDRGNYKETDEILPFNLYSWTKLGGECSARMVKNHLIIRTSFGPSEFAYKEAFIDKWVSKDYVDVIAPMILEAALSPLTGVLNLGTERTTIYQYASQRSNVKGTKLSDTSHLTPYDNSFNLQKWIDYKSSKAIATPHTKCRCCGSSDLEKYLDLGLMPLANNLEISSIRAKEIERYPLQVMFCNSCGLSQLSVIIDPVKMFSYYTYRSGINAPYAHHCMRMAYSTLFKYAKGEVFHIDIAGNDGTLLNEFRKIVDDKFELKYTCLNVDPASNLTAISEAQGIPAKTDFWSPSLVPEILAEYGEADLITATNVFAHVDNIKDFLLACKYALRDNGIILIECPYLVDFIENMEFDTVYFEHLSYMSVIPMNKVCVELGLRIISVEKQLIHGGTIRVLIAKDLSSHQTEDSAIQFMINENKGAFNEIERYKCWAKDVHCAIKDFGKQIYNLKKQGFKIAAFAASAKGNTLLNASNLNTDFIDYIVDQTPEKIGKYSPGTGIPIVNKDHLRKHPPDYIIILSWNFSEVIIPQIKEICDAKIIIPIPEFVIL